MTCDTYFQSSYFNEQKRVSRPLLVRENRYLSDTSSRGSKVYQASLKVFIRGLYYLTWPFQLQVTKHDDVELFVAYTFHLLYSVWRRSTTDRRSLSTTMNIDAINRSPGLR